MIALGKCSKDHQKKDTGKTEHWVYRMEKVIRQRGQQDSRRWRKPQRHQRTQRAWKDRGRWSHWPRRAVLSGHIFNTPAVCIAALFTTARTQKQPRGPSTDERIKKLWYLYTMEYYSAIKRNPFDSVLMRWMNLEPIIQSEVSQKEKDKYHILMHIYGI